MAENNLKEMSGLKAFTVFYILVKTTRNKCRLDV